MIPSTSISAIYIKIIGESSLFSIAHNNLINNLERIRKVRAYTFLANNAQTRLGTSRNFGHERYYSWEDTIIDCRNSPTIIYSDTLNDLNEIIAESPKFKRFKNDIEERAGGLITVTPFHNTILGVDNMRYNIKRSSKLDDFDMVRIGIKLYADNERDFSIGLKNISDHENPFNIRVPVARA